MAHPLKTAEWLAEQFRARAKDDPAENTEKDAREVEAMRDFVEEALSVLGEYADLLCEHTTNYEGCGKLSSDDCGGCKARALVNKARKEKP